MQAKTIGCTGDEPSPSPPCGAMRTRYGGRQHEQGGQRADGRVQPLRDPHPGEASQSCVETATRVWGLATTDVRFC